MAVGEVCNMAAIDEPLFTLDEVAEKLKIHPRTVLQFVKAGELEAVKLGHQWRFSASAIEKLLENAKWKQA